MKGIASHVGMLALGLGLGILGGVAAKADPPLFGSRGADHAQDHDAIRKRLRAVPETVRLSMASNGDTVTLVELADTYRLVFRPTRAFKGADESQAAWARAVGITSQAWERAGHGLHGPRLLVVAFSDYTLTTSLADVTRCRRQQDPEAVMRCVLEKTRADPVKQPEPAEEKP